MTDGKYVTWDRWDAEHDSLVRRVAAIEAGIEARRKRVWTIMLTAISGLVFPLMLSALIALSHLPSANG